MNTKGDYKDTNLLEWIHAVDDLNDEVEIIEEEKEIEKIGKIYDGFTDSYYDTC